MSTFLKPIITHLRDALSNFLYQFSNTDGLNSFFYSRGWLSNLEDTDLAAVHTAINIKTDIENIIELVKSIDNGSEPLVTTIENNLPIIKNLIEDLKALKDITASVSNPFPLNQSAFWTELGENLFDDILISHIKDREKNLFAVLHLMQIIEYTDIIPTAANRIPYTKKSFNWSKLGDLFTKPTALVKSNYNWGKSLTPNYNKLFETLETIFFNYGIFPERTLVKSNYYSDLYGSFTPSVPIEGFEIKLIEGWNNYTNDYKKVSLTLLPALNSSNDQLTGFVLVPHIVGYSSLEIPISPELLIKGEGYFESDNFVNFEVTPESSNINLNPLSSTTTIAGKISLVYLPVMPLVILGQAGSSCLMFNGAELSLGMRGSLSDPEFVFNIGLGEIIKNSNFLFAYEPGEGDGFIQKILGKRPFSSEFGLGLQWSSKSGIQFIGSGGLELEIPLHDEKKGEENDAPLRINVLRIGFGIGNGAFKLNAGVDVSFKLGIFSGVVNDIGASLTLKQKTSSESRGILGSLDFDWHFKYPKGIGISVDGGKLTGGGFLSIDPEKGRYVGALQLSLLDKFDLTALAIITTKAPDGSKGFSLLAMLNVEFEPAIELGLGFSLSGLGGMLAVNRRMSAEAIRLGVKSGAIDRILFPDPEKFIENVPTIVRDLEGIFPTQKDRYVFGLFFLINWGVSQEFKVLDIKLGILAEFPSPIKLAIIGTLGMKLPENEPTITLKVAFAGFIDLEKKYLSFDASIYDSKILTYSLSGDMAVRLFWGDRSELLLSVGGFHPSYTPPSFLLLPAKMERMTILLFDTKELSLKMMNYFAVTSNTAQFGARIEFLLNVKVFKVIGLLGLDVLFQFNPFKLIAQIEAMLAVFSGKRELLSVAVKANLEGPGPWHAWGTGEFRVLGMTASANFDENWGPAPKTTLPEISVEPLVRAALTENSAWRTVISDKKKEVVSLKKLENVFILHPSGQLIIGQKIAPLGIKLSRYGTQKISDGGLYNISEVKIADEVQITQSDLEQFAPANYREMNDDQKLKSASFEYLRSGVRVNTPANVDLYMDNYVVKEVKYDRVIIDKLFRKPNEIVELNSVLVNDFVSGGVIGTNDLGAHIKKVTNRPILNVNAQQEKYQIVSKDSLEELSTLGVGLGPTVSNSLADVNTLLENILKTKPGLAGKIQAVPVY